MEYVKSCMQQHGSVESFLSKRLETICTEITIKTNSPLKKTQKLLHKDVHLQNKNKYLSKTFNEI